MKTSRINHISKSNSLKHTFARESQKLAVLAFSKWKSFKYFCGKKIKSKEMFCHLNFFNLRYFWLNPSTWIVCYGRTLLSYLLDSHLWTGLSPSSPPASWEQRLPSHKQNKLHFSPKKSITPDWEFCWPGCNTGKLCSPLNDFIQPVKLEGVTLTVSHFQSVSCISSKFPEFSESFQ